MTTLLVLAGLAQLAIVAASLLAPRVLHWREELARLTPLTRTIFWTYAGYISATNLALALVSLRADWLLTGEPLARAVAAYGALYWGVRFVLQMTCYRKHAPRGPWYALADAGLTLAFAFAAGVFAAAALT
jgi:hypothetical protein